MEATPTTAKAHKFYAVVPGGIATVASYRLWAVVKYVDDQVFALLSDDGGAAGWSTKAAAETIAEHSAALVADGAYAWGEVFTSREDAKRFGSETLDEPADLAEWLDG